MSEVYYAKVVHYLTNVVFAYLSNHHVQTPAQGGLHTMSSKFPAVGARVPPTHDILNEHRASCSSKKNCYSTQACVTAVPSALAWR